MKKTFILFSIFSTLLFVQCSKDEDDDPQTPTDTNTETTEYDSWFEGTIAGTKESKNLAGYNSVSYGRSSSGCTYGYHAGIVTPSFTSDNYEGYELTFDNITFPEIEPYYCIQKLDSILPILANNYVWKSGYDDETKHAVYFDKINMDGTVLSTVYGDQTGSTVTIDKISTEINDPILKAQFYGEEYFKVEGTIDCKLYNENGVYQGDVTGGKYMFIYAYSTW